MARDSQIAGRIEKDWRCWSVPRIVRAVGDTSLGWLLLFALIMSLYFYNDIISYLVRMDTAARMNRLGVVKTDRDYPPIEFVPDPALFNTED